MSGPGAVLAQVMNRLSPSRGKRPGRNDAGKTDGSQALLCLQGVTARYDRDLVLRDVSLEVRRGEVVCLLGSNGAGKSTVVRSILGFLRPVSGAIRFDGRRIDGQAPHQACGLGIGVVLEGRRLFGKMSVTENLLMGVAGDEDRSELRSRVHEMEEMFPLLADRANQPAGLLSGGEQAQVAIARALMGHPELLILDEPSLGLSPRLCSEVINMTRRIASGGTTVLLIEQNVRQTLAVADRGYVLQKGEIIASGLADALMDDEAVRQAYLFI